MRKIALLSVTVVVAATLPGGASAGPTLDATTRGRTCGSDEQGQLYCDFKVGRDLWFSIVGIGAIGQSLTVFKADWDGDYYLAFGLDHQCIIVKPGQTRERLLSDLPDFAFVSLKSAKVFADWPACKANL